MEIFEWFSSKNNFKMSNVSFGYRMYKPIQFFAKAACFAINNELQIDDYNKAKIL